MELLSLPDDCLLLVFEHCPLQQLIPLELVSRRFYNVIKQICNSKQKLKIFGSFYEIQRYDQSLKENYIDHIPDFKIGYKCSDVIIINNPASESIYKISQSFPNVTDLVLNCSSFETIDLKLFLELWRLQLKSFAIWGLPKTVDTNNLKSFWDCINTMERLKKLHLMILTKYKLPDNFTVISQLVLFHQTSYHYDLVPVLSHISSEIVLILSNVYFGPEQLEKLIKRNPLITQRIVGFDFGFFLSKCNRLENFSKTFHFACDRFSEMSFMDLMFGEHLPLAEIIPSLNKLKNLRILSFYVGRDQIPANSDDFFTYPQFLAVKYLQLEVFGLNQTTFWKIIRLFPNIKFMILKHDFEFSETQNRELKSKIKQEFLKISKVILK